MFVFLPSNKSVQTAFSDLGYLQFAQTLLKYFDSDFGNRMYGMKQMTSQFFFNRIRYKTSCLVRVFVVFYSLLTCGAPTNGRFVDVDVYFKKDFKAPYLPEKWRSNSSNLP